ncbi:MAG TPA: hypothetical protein VMS76_01400 [Planctomycetota bacterium]|nr:hypothetical protein [Planctomycetota bacterium]
MMRTHALGSATFLATALLLAAPAAADRVVTQDGRVLTPKKVKPQGEGYLLVFESGEITLSDKSQVKAVEIEGDMSDYVPQNEDEKKKLEQGYVRYQGKWLSKPAYEDVLRSEHAKSRARADDLAAHSNFHNAWSKDTKHFTVVTNTSPELLDYYAELLEAYYDVMDARFKIKLSPSLRRTRMTVNIYKSRREFHKLNKLGAGGGVAGYFYPGDQTLNFYHDYQEPAITDWVALHEGTHLLTYLIDPQYIPQIWLNEAVADYFGSAEIRRDKKGRLEIEPGRLQTDRVLTVQQAIQDGKDIALDDLFTISRNDFEAFEYAHAWSFVYFLNQSSPRYKKAFDRFFKDLYTLKKGVEYEIVNYADKSGTGKIVPPAEIRRVVLDSLGNPDVKALDKEWKEFIAAIPIEGPQARFKRGSRAVFFGEMFAETMEETKRNAEAARTDLDAAIEGGVRDARAWWARSKVRVVQGEMNGAREDLDKAIELDPLNATYRFDKGMMLSGITVIGGDGMPDLDDDTLGKEKNPEAKEWFGLAAELAPENDFFRRVHERFQASE